MSKRFIDVSSLPKAWRKLDNELKLAWFYLWNNCDPAGVWEIDEDLFEFQNNFSLDIKALSDALGDLIEYDSEKVLLTNFIAINQCDLKKLNPNYNPHKPVFRSINKHQLKLDSSLNQASLKLVVGVEVVVEEEVENFGKSENLLNETEFFDKVCEYFSMTNDQMKMTVKGFFRSIENRGAVEKFKEQVEAYIQYKNISEERIHSWQSFEKNWDSIDWVDKLNKEKQRNQEAKETSVNGFQQIESVSKSQVNLKSYEEARKTLIGNEQGASN